MSKFDFKSKNELGIAMGPIFILAIIVIIFCMAILMIFRQQCINEGYKISKLSSELDEKMLRYEDVSQKYSDALRWEVLFDKAEEMNFTFPVGGKVFYVQ